MKVKRFKGGSRGDTLVCSTTYTACLPTPDPLPEAAPVDVDMFYQAVFFVRCTFGLDLTSIEQRPVSQELMRYGWVPLGIQDHLPIGPVRSPDAYERARSVAAQLGRVPGTQVPVFAHT